MAEPWHADITLSPATAKRLIADQFPDVPAHTAELAAEGWDNWLYRAGSWIFRFPRRQVVVPAVEIEMAVLPGLAPMLPLPIPDAARRGTPDPQFPYPFFGYREIPGRATGQAAPTPKMRRQSAVPLAEFLHVLHNISPRDAARLGAGPPLFNRLDLDVTVPRFGEWMDKAAARGLLPVRGAPLLAEAERLRAAAGLFFPPLGLAHGDLNFKNVLLDDSGALSGVVDWCDVHIGHPAVDLALAWGLLPSASRQVFLEAYGPVDSLTWRVARFMSWYVNLIVLVSAADSHNAADVREAQWEILNAADDT